MERIRQALVQHRESIALAVNDELNRSTLTGDRKLQRYVGVRSETGGARCGCRSSPQHDAW